MQPELRKLVTRLGAALPQLVLFAPALDSLQMEAASQLGPQALHRLRWAWQRRAILGKSSAQLLQGLPPDWRALAQPLMAAWDAAVRESLAVENWHSVLRPYLAVHRTLSTGMLARLSVWHNHRVAKPGLHQGQSPLMRSGMTPVSNDWLVTLGYPPHEAACSPASLVNLQPTLALAA